MSAYDAQQAILSPQFESETRHTLFEAGLGTPRDVKSRQKLEKGRGREVAVAGAASRFDATLLVPVDFSDLPPSPQTFCPGVRGLSTGATGTKGQLQGEG